jgi:hypothetical protein
MTPASMTARYNRQSSLQRYFGAAMEQVNAFLAFLDEITPDGLRAFWGRRMFPLPPPVWIVVAWHR